MSLNSSKSSCISMQTVGLSETQELVTDLLNQLYGLALRRINLGSNLKNFWLSPLITQLNNHTALDKNYITEISLKFAIDNLCATLFTNGDQQLPMVIIMIREIIRMEEAELALEML